MNKIALKMLVGDKMKFMTLVIAIAFSTMLVTQQGSIFVGLIRLFSTMVRVTQGPVWVMDKATEMVDAPNVMPDSYIEQIKSIDGVKWAEPLLLNKVNAKLPSGRQKFVQLVGVDGDTLVGMPQNVISGELKAINLPDSVILDNNELKLMGNPSVGDTFEINDRRAIVAAIIKMPRNAFSYPMVYTTYNRAKSYSPPQRNLLSFILVKPQEGYTDKQLVKIINKTTSLKARTQKEFYWDTIMWYMKNTGIPINFGIAVALGILVGTAIASQTFYNFTLENIRYLATFKAIGADNIMLTKMVLIQSSLVGSLGFGIGVGISTVFGSTVPNVSKLVFYTPYQLLIFAFVVIVGVCIFSSYFSINKIRKIEPAVIFRS